MPTYTPKTGDIVRSWHVVDADGLVLGRLASEVAKLLRGKHKPTFVPHQDTGDHVVIVNAEKVVLTGGKAANKAVYDHSGYPGGMRTRSYKDFLVSQPEEALRRTIGGMLPKNRLGRQMLRKLKVYSGPNHPHQAQRPEPLTLEHTRAPGRKLVVESRPSSSEFIPEDTFDELVDEEVSLTDLELSSRLLNSLKSAGIETVDDLLTRTANDVLGIDGVGPKSLEELIEVLAGNNMSLRDSD